MDFRSGISGAILAGGQSRRMGEEKALVKIGNTPLIERAVQSLKSAIPKPMIITNNPEKLAYLNLPLHRDILPNLGPLGGIYTALKYASEKRVLVLACDLPSVTLEIIRALCTESIHQDVLALDAGFGPEPLCAVYSKRCLPVIQAQIEQGNLKVTDFYPPMNKVGVLTLEAIGDSIPGGRFLNVNTPADKLLAEKIYGGEDQ